MTKRQETEPRPAYIYVLVDPFSGLVRYVGKSIRPRERLINQCNEHSNTYRCHWIRSLVARGARPLQVIVAVVPAGGDWQSVERAWIQVARELGWPLVNGTDGGDGVVGLSAESRAKMSATWKGRKHRPETLVKMAAARRGMKHTEANKEHMRRLMTGREFTPEWRAKIAAGVRRLTPEQVEQIRACLSRKESQYAIADRFGVHQTTISNIHRGRYYP